MDEQTKAALAGLKLLLKANQSSWQQTTSIAVENQRNIATIRAFLEAQAHDDPAK